MKYSPCTADIKYLRQALALAKKGIGKTAPNPAVGCVLVKNGAVVGEGYHEYFGGPHAEINAIAQAGRDADGATLYVTLEPCNHWGKTPPCTDAIIRAGIRRVVAPLPDPNPRTRGDGFRKLAAHGIEVATGLLRHEAARINARYIASFKHSRAPAVIIKAAVSLDGKIATRTGDSRWITGPKARAFVHRFRAGIDALLVGIGTVMKDNPSLTSHGQGPNPVRVIVDPKLRIPLSSAVLDGQAPAILFYSEKTRSKKVQRLKKMRILAVALPETGGRMSFRDIIGRLSMMSLSRVMIEGGGETIAAALKDKVVSEALFFINPRIIGGREATTAVEGEGVARICESVALTGVHVRKIGPDILVRGKVRYP